LNDAYFEGTDELSFHHTIFYAHQPISSQCFVNRLSSYFI
jgi:hypothetical protein